MTANMKHRGTPLSDTIASMSTRRRSTSTTACAWALLLICLTIGAAPSCRAFTVTTPTSTSRSGISIGDGLRSTATSSMVGPPLRASVIRSSNIESRSSSLNWIGIGNGSKSHHKSRLHPSLKRSHRQRRLLSPLPALPFDEDGPVDIPNEVDNFDAKTTAALVAGQSALVAVAVLFATILGTSNYGLGSGFAISSQALQSGAIATIPLFVLAFVLDFVEKGVPALQDVTKATQRSVLALLGRKRKPLIALGTALALGAAAGIGEEMLFRGVLQEALATRFGDSIAVISSSIVFGLLHAVTPLYAALASLASFFFGFLYLKSSNLAVPIICHGLYDVGALLWAHWTVTDLSFEEQTYIIEWQGPEEEDSSSGGKAPSSSSSQ
mmetsp:Transcript_25548/g.73873  ORF Transcript_25548/g.73873 Transcript_25548/m.73873 type:complete len:382 (+) Transcript_25548:34-1179(+)